MKVSPTKSRQINVIVFSLVSVLNSAMRLYCQLSELRPINWFWILLHQTSNQNSKLRMRNPKITNKSKNYNHKTEIKKSFNFILYFNLQESLLKVLHGFWLRLCIVEDTFENHVVFETTCTYFHDMCVSTLVGK